MKIRSLLQLFISFFKIGLFTFGGGYAMIPLIQKEASEKRKWIKEGEILDILAISESTPGPIAVNSATFIGYRVSGVLGAIVATFGLVLPSFCIILLISIFYESFRHIAFIDAMFKGIKVGVILILVNAIIKLSKLLKKELFPIILFLVALIVSITLSFFNITTIPSISIILIIFGLLMGLLVTFVISKKGKNSK